MKIFKTIIKFLLGISILPVLALLLQAAIKEHPYHEPTINMTWLYFAFIVLPIILITVGWKKSKPFCAGMFISWVLLWIMFVGAIHYLKEKIGAREQLKNLTDQHNGTR